ncbi:Aspartic proteinase nepenthesin-1 [Triticum urartu]|uniref:Aspartic proteinase nepenthesin-1 n=1 Tax=Triticum urartu TaxID=4572 RepID=M7ZYP0_TRIUA|nr:aspartic proteinase nepenthesin-1-like [Triticum urartu]EMS65167.1 Aspartic proteinase nepenthesin-1 [Triticum urartu]
MDRPPARRARGAVAMTVLLLLLLPGPASSLAGAAVGVIVRSPFMKRIASIIVKEVASAGASALTKALRSSNKAGQLGSDAADDAGIILYNVSVGQQTFSGVVDIFNDFFWVQCPPAPAQVLSAVPCISDTCSSVLRKTTNNDCVDTTSSCLYAYGSLDDGSYSTGYLGYEKFTFGAGTGTSPVSGSVVFGCSTQNTVKDGAIGFSKGPLSILSQLHITRFSYFLTPDDSKSSSSTSVVLLGDQAVPQTKRSRSTPLLKSNVYQDLYYVKLTGIKVDGESLKGIPDRAFDFAADGKSGGVALSTTIALTWLQSDAYYAVKQALMSKIDSPAVKSNNELDLCYDTNSVAKLKFPKITLVFDGVDSPGMDLTTVHYFYKDTNTGFQCLTMLPMPKDYPLGSILGSMLQAGTNMIYDIGARQLTFEKAAAAAPQVPLMAIVSLLAWVLLF